MSESTGSSPADPSIEELLRHTRWVEALARRLVHDQAAAEDVSQATWVVALRDRHTPKVDVRAWLASVVRNLARERHRRDAQRGHVERAGARNEALPSTDELASRAEAERDVVAGVLSLDEVDRRTLLLRYFEGLSAEDVARREGVAVQTVHNRVSRAHAHLRERLELARGRQWLPALAPLLLRRVDSAPVAPSSFQALIMSTSTKLVVAVLVVATALFFLLQRNEEVTRPLASAEATQASSASSTPLSTAARETSRAPVASVEDASRATPVATPQSKPDPATSSTKPASVGGRIHGIVYRPDGEVAPRRRVRMVFCPDGTQKGEKEVVLHTDELGRFAQDGLRKGVWAVATWPDESELLVLGLDHAQTMGGMALLRERSVDVDVDSDVELLLGRPSPTQVKVTGRVRRAEVPDESPLLQWFPPGKDSISREFVSLTREAGTYEVTVDEPGTYLVTVASRNGMPHADFVVTVPSGPAFTRDFDLPTNVVRGLVVDAAGQPVKDAVVGLTPRRLEFLPSHLFLMLQPAKTGATGSFEFAGLPEGRYDVTLLTAKLGESTAAAKSVRDVAAAPTDRFDPLRFRAEAGIEVPVRILAPDGEKSSAVLFVFDAAGEPLNGTCGPPFAVQGAKQALVLSPGRYSFVAGRYFRWSQARDVEIVAGREVEPIDLRLEPAALLEISAPGLERAWIDVRDEAGRRMTILSDGAGANRAVQRDWSPDKRVWRLPAGNYTIEARSFDGVVIASAKSGVLAGERKSVVLRR